jgi:hypothetical protein
VELRGTAEELLEVHDMFSNLDVRSIATNRI